MTPDLLAPTGHHQLNWKTLQPSIIPGPSSAANLHADHQEVEGNELEEALAVLAEETQPHGLALNVEPATVERLAEEPRSRGAVSVHLK